MILSNVLGLAGAESTDDFTAFITYPDQEYYIGSTVTAHVHVFLDGDYTDPDIIEFSVGRTGRSVPLTREGSGIYRASFVIEDRDTGEEIVWFEAHVWMGTEWAPCVNYVYLSDFPFLDVGVFINDSSDITPVPGQIVEFTVHTTSLGEFVDPDPGMLMATVGNRDIKTNCELTRESTGVYRGAFVVPADLEIYDTFEITASANLTTGRFMDTDTGSASIRIRTFDVWFRCVDLTSTSASVDIHVLDSSGNTLAGAALSLSSYYWMIDKGPIEESYNLTCDASGRVRLELNFSNVSSRDSTIQFSGNVSHGGTSQFVFGILPAPEPVFEPEPNQPPFRVELLDDFYLPVGADVQLTYVVTFENSTLAGQDLYGRVYGDHGVYWHGNVTTDETGSFTFEFTTPVTMAALQGYEHLRTRFGAWVNGTLRTAQGTPSLIVCSHNNTYISRVERSPTTFFQVSEGPGDREYGLNLYTEGADGSNDNAMILWGVGSADSYWSEDGEIIEYMNYGFKYNGAAALPTAWSDGAHRAVLKVPDFVPPGANLYAVGIVRIFDGPVSETRYAYIANISAFLVDLPPSVRIDSPVNGSVYRGEVLAAGTATDDHGVRTVMVRLDGGNWTRATGTTAWNFLIDLDELDDGYHTLEAISYDGLMYSPVTRVEFEYAHEVRTGEGSWLWLVLVIIITIVLCGIAIYRFSKTRHGS